MQKQSLPRLGALFIFLLVLATVQRSAASPARVHLDKRGHSECGCDGQCGPGKSCFTCGWGGWNCGSDSWSACGESVPAAGACPPAPPKHDECGCDDQCGSGKKCFACSWGGYNCGVDSRSACGELVRAAGACPPAPPKHDECGCDGQCGSGKKCFTCSWGGYNCGVDSRSACGELVGAAGACPPAPPKHDECGCDSQCALGVCWKCLSGGYKCGLNFFDACQDARVVQSVGPCGTCAKDSECPASRAHCLNWNCVECTSSSQCPCAGGTVYNAIPFPLPPGMPSQAFEATQTYEYGDFVVLGGSARSLGKVSVVMTSWAPYAEWAGTFGDAGGWSWPFTLNIYSVKTGSPNTIDTKIASMTTFQHIHWRPPTDNTHCPQDANHNWDRYQGIDGKCYSGYNTVITFDFTFQAITLPDKVVVTVAYNTEHYGYAPVGKPGPYNSLNVGAQGTVTAGQDGNTDAVFLVAHHAVALCDASTTLQSGLLVEDPKCGQYGTTPIRIEAANCGVCSNNKCV